MRNWVFIILTTFLFPVKNVSSQVRLSLSDADGSAIPYASCYFKANSLGAMSGEGGNASIAILSSQLPDSLIIEHLSCQRKALWLDTIPQHIIEITLLDYSNSMRLVVIEAISVYNLRKNIEQNFRKNYHPDENYFSGFYRQVHKENGKFVRLIEAQVAVKNKGCTNRYADTQRDLFAVHAVRRSRNYERNGDQHGDHLVDLFHENPIMHTSSTFLDASQYDLYDYELDSKHQDVNTYKVHFKNKKWMFEKNVKGWFIVDALDYGIYEIQIESFANIKQNGVPLAEWQFQNGTYHIVYEKGEEYYELKYAKQWYNHHLYNKTWNKYEFIVEETFEWLTLDITNETVANKYKVFTNLYSLQSVYNTKEWEVELPQISKEVIVDLSHQVGLESQFGE